MSSLVLRFLSIVLVCLLGLAAPSPADDTRSAMADAMVRMMEAMGLFGSTGGSFSSGPPGWSNPMGMSGWPSGFGAMPAMPGMPGAGSVPMPSPGGTPMDPTTQMGQMGQMMERFAPGAAPWGTGPLEGIWEGSDDGLLIVQGERYRLYAPLSGSIDGDIRVKGDLVELSNPRESFTQEFEYALDQGRLVFRDRHGQIYLYRRLVLDGGR